MNSLEGHFDDKIALKYVSRHETINTLGVEFVYSATGERLVKAKYNAGKTLVSSATFHYMGSFVFDNTGVLAYILTGEGRILKSGSNFIYEYNLTDQLGYTRAVIQANSNGSYTPTQKLGLLCLIILCTIIFLC